MCHRIDLQGEYIHSEKYDRDLPSDHVATLKGAARGATLLAAAVRGRGPGWERAPVREGSPAGDARAGFAVADPVAAGSVSWRQTSSVAGGSGGSATGTVSARRGSNAQGKSVVSDGGSLAISTEVSHSLPSSFSVCMPYCVFFSNSDSMP